MIGRMFQRRGNQLVEVTNPSVILADASNSELAQEAFYVSPDGDDASDGLTQATALATIGEALNRVSRSCKNAATVYLAGGTYGETVIIDGLFVYFDLQGDVTITGDLDIRRLSTVSVFSSNDAKFTADSIITNASSRLTFDACRIDATRIAARTGSIIALTDTVTSCVLRPGTGISAIVVKSNAVLENYAVATSVIGSNSENVYVALEGGVMYCASPLTVTGSFTSRIFYVDSCAAAFISKNVTSTASCATGIYCVNGSSIRTQNITMTVSNYTGSAATAGYSSSIVISNSTFTFTRSGTAQSNQISSSSCSTICFINSSLSIRANGCNSFLIADATSYLAIDGNGPLALNGSVVNYTVAAIRNSTVRLDSTLTISGTVTGQRYYAGVGGQISVGGKSATWIPGSTAGTPTSASPSASYGYYG